MHRFWRCPHSVAAWDVLRDLSGLSLRAPGGAILRQKDLQGWVLDWIGSLSDKELAIGMMMLYQLCLARNEARDEEQIVDPRSVARRAIFLVEDWLACNWVLVVGFFWLVGAVYRAFFCG